MKKVEPITSWDRITVKQLQAIYRLGISDEYRNIDVPGGGGSGGGSIGGTATAPLTPQLSQSTLLQQQQINQQGSAVTRAFVVETDVTNNQERVRKLNRAARIR